MRSTIAMRLGAAVSVSALALSLGTAPSSATDSPEPFATSSAPTADRPNARLATGADFARTSAARSSASVVVTPNANVTKIKGYSGVLNDPTENFIDFDLSISNTDEIDDVSMYLTVDGKKTGSLPLWYDPDQEIYFVVVPDNVGLGKARFYGTMISYTPESTKTPTWDSTDSNSFYVRRDVYVDVLDYALSPSGKTKTFTIEGMQIYSPSRDGFTALSKVKLQYKTGGKWKTKKTIYLDAQGNGTYKFVRTKKYYYRLVYGMTSTFIGFNSGPTPKI